MGIKVFISYCIKDSTTFSIPEIARNLQNLTEIEDVKFWEDHALENIQEYMRTYVNNCNILVLFCSTNSLESKPVIKEWKNALEKKKRIVPIFFLLEHVPPPIQSMRGCQFVLFKQEENIRNLSILLQKIAQDMIESNSAETERMKEQEQDYHKKIKNFEEELKKITSLITNQETELSKEPSIKKSHHKIEFASDWSNQIDIKETGKFRKEMIKNLLDKSNMRDLLDKNVLKAMEIVPREIFIDWGIVSRLPQYKKEPHLQLAYRYNEALPIAKNCNISSPEIIASQLSLVKIKSNHKVLFVGAKGGYIESLVAEIVGAGGIIVIYSGDEDVLRRSFEVCVNDTPYAEIMKFMKAKDVFDINPIKKYGFFNVIFVCGAVPKIPTSFAYLLEDNGILLAPVGSEEHQQYTILEKVEKTLTKRVIKDFGVIFGPIR